MRSRYLYYRPVRHIDELYTHITCFENLSTAAA